MRSQCSVNFSRVVILEISAEQKNNGIFKKRLVQMHLEEGRTIKSLSEEYQVSENGIGYWLKKYREECSKNPAAQEEYDLK